LPRTRVALRATALFAGIAAGVVTDRSFRSADIGIWSSIALASARFAVTAHLTGLQAGAAAPSVERTKLGISDVHIGGGKGGRPTEAKEPLDD
jgi:hypothetical protein